jgi:hypothetical protein
VRWSSGFAARSPLYSLGLRSSEAHRCTFKAGTRSLCGVERDPRLLHGSEERGSDLPCPPSCLPLRCSRHADRARLERDDSHRGGRLPEVLLGAHPAGGSADGGTRGAQGDSCGTATKVPRRRGLLVRPFQRKTCRVEESVPGVLPSSSSSEPIRSDL